VRLRSLGVISGRPTLKRDCPGEPALLDPCTPPPDTTSHLVPSASPGSTHSHVVRAGNAPPHFPNADGRASVILHAAARFSYCARGPFPEGITMTGMLQGLPRRIANPVLPDDLCQGPHQPVGTSSGVPRGEEDLRLGKPQVFGRVPAAQRLGAVMPSSNDRVLCPPPACE